MALDLQIQALAQGFDPWASARLSGAYRDQPSIGEPCRLDRERCRYFSAPSSSRADPREIEIPGPGDSVRAMLFRLARGIRHCHGGLSYRNVADQ
jgi:hypothetical protein